MVLTWIPLDIFEGVFMYAVQSTYGIHSKLKSIVASSEDIVHWNTTSLLKERTGESRGIRGSGERGRERDEGGEGTWMEDKRLSYICRFFLRPNRVQIHYIWCMLLSVYNAAYIFTAERNIIFF